MKAKQILVLIVSVVLLSACGNSLQRAERTVGLIQDHVTAIIGKISEIQNQEADIQANFEATIKASEDLSAFNQADSPIEANVQKRQALLDEIDDHRKQLIDLADELGDIPQHKDLPQDQMKMVMDYVKNLTGDLDQYVARYQANLKTEAITYKSIANPSTNHESFFKVFDNVNLLYTENNMNLDKVLVHFESLNHLLVNLKVYLVNLHQ